MKRSEFKRRAPLVTKRGIERKKGLRSVSVKRARENRTRRRVLLDIYGQSPVCALCGPLQEHGVVTGCNGWADDGDEILRRSAGGSIVDPDNIRPVGRRCHTWLTEHPRQARDWGLEERAHG